MKSYFSSPCDNYFHRVIFNKLRTNILISLELACKTGVPKNKFTTAAHLTTNKRDK
jgi:hypothetical protein